MIISSYFISTLLNPNYKYKKSDMLYNENYQVIKMLLENKKNIPNNMSLELNSNILKVFHTELPVCKTKVYHYNISSKLYEKIHNHYAFIYCVSFKSRDNNWINFVIKTKMGIYKTIVLLNFFILVEIIFIIICSFILFKIILPIKIFQNNAYELGMTLDRKNIRPAGIKMLYNLASSLNFMQNKLFNALNIRTKMLSMITHDLKSPISRLKLRYELNLTDNEKNFKDITLLEQLANQILLNIRDNMFEHENQEILDLEILLKEIISSYSNIEISSDINDTLITARKTSLIRAFDNLISNSKKHSDKVSIKISSKGKYIEISIKDYGTGIKPSELNDIFRPFYQLEGTVMGHGLGLTIAQEIILSHNGVIDIKNHYEPNGVIVNVKLLR